MAYHMYRYIALAATTPQPPSHQYAIVCGGTSPRYWPPVAKPGSGPGGGPDKMSDRHVRAQFRCGSSKASPTDNCT
eukprot:scaffold1397_cov122-Isochrysis_galbana.AAC.3